MLTESLRRRTSWMRREPASSTAALIALCLLTVLLWLPTGLSVGYWADDWVMHARSDAGVVSLWGDVRPLTPLPFALGHALSPDSTHGLNLVLLVILAVKACSVYGLISELSGQKRLAFAVAVLSLLSPADTSVFNLGTVNVQQSLAAVLAGLTFSLLAWRRGRWWWLPMWACTVLALLTYELAYMVVLVGPLVLLFREGRLNRRVLAHAAAWYAPAVLTLLYSAIVLLSTQNALDYQRGLAAPASLAEMLHAQGRYVWRLFWAGWQFDTLNSGLRWYERSAALIVFVTSVLFLPVRQSGRRTLVLAVAGAGMIVLTSLLYLPTQLRLSYDRTLMFSGVGAALCAGALLWWLLQRVRGGATIFALAMAGVAAVGVNGLTQQHLRYAREAAGQQAMLRVLITATGQVASGTTVIVLDDTANAEVRAAFLPYNIYVEVAWRVVQAPAANVNLVLCYPDEAQGWGRYNERCALSPEGVQAENAEGARQFASDSLVVIRYRGGGQAEIVPAEALPFAAGSYQPQTRANPAQLPVRAVTLLGMQAARGRENSP